MKDKFKILSEETNRILELNSKLNKKISLNESTTRDLTVTVKDTLGDTIAGVIVYDVDNINTMNAITNVYGKAILKNFSGTKIKTQSTGYLETTVDVEDSKKSIEIILRPPENIVGADSKPYVEKKNVTIKVVDLKTKTPIKDIKVFITTNKNEKKEKSTDENGYFSFNYGTDLTTVSLNNGYTQQNFSLSLKKNEKQIPSDKGVFKTIEFNNFIPVKIQLKNSETGQLIPITEEIISDIDVSVDDLTAFNKKLDIDNDSISDNTITLELNLSYISDSTKLIVKLPGFLKTSVAVPSEITGPIVVTLTAEVEEPERVKLPKGIRLGDVYESETLYNVMRKYLGLCGEKYQEY